MKERKRKLIEVEEWEGEKEGDRLVQSVSPGGNLARLAASLPALSGQRSAPPPLAQARAPASQALSPASAPRLASNPVPFLPRLRLDHPPSHQLTRSAIALPRRSVNLDRRTRDKTSAVVGTTR